jgi:hypothetical protein
MVNEKPGYMLDFDVVKRGLEKSKTKSPIMMLKCILLVIKLIKVFYFQRRLCRSNEMPFLNGKIEH